jgi:hypothetical protein
MRKFHRNTIEKYLLNRDWEGLLAWDDGNVTRILSSLILSENPLLRWRAVEALGNVCGYEASRGKVKPARKIIQRMLWGMNDESGALIWSAPEVMAEILVRVPQLIDEFGSILASHINLEPFPRGVHWGIARISEIRPDVFSEMTDVLKASLQSDDPYIRGCALMALGNLRATSVKDELEKMRDDKASFDIYDMNEGEFRQRAISGLCQEALEKIG